MDLGWVNGGGDRLLKLRAIALALRGRRYS
jgi:hypothetical protein